MKCVYSLSIAWENIYLDSYIPWLKESLGKLRSNHDVFQRTFENRRRLRLTNPQLYLDQRF